MKKIKHPAIVLLSFFVVLLFSASSYAMWTRLGPDVRVTDYVADSMKPSMVWTGSNFGVAWSDERDGNSEIYFARLDSLGNKIGGDVRITNDAAYSGFPSLVWTGTGYGVCWEDHSAPYYKVYFARIDSSGNKIGGDVMVSDSTGHASECSLAWTGTEYGVAWKDTRISASNTEIYFARIDSSGNKVGNDIRVTYADYSSWEVSLVWATSNYGLAWLDYRLPQNGIFFVRLDALGNKIGSDNMVVPSTNGLAEPNIVWSGSEYGLVWEDWRSGDLEIYFALIDSSGNKASADARITNAPGRSWYSAIAWNGSEYGLTWYDFRDPTAEVYFARVDAAGNLTDTDFRVSDLPDSSYFPTIASYGTGYGIAWNDLRNGDAEIYFARVGDNPGVIETIPVLTEWALAALALLLAAAIALAAKRRSRPLDPA